MRYRDCGLDSLEKDLFAEIEKIGVIDCHEHLMFESQRLSRPADLFTLFEHYTCGDLRSAGMSAEHLERMLDRSLPLEVRWKLFSPWFRYIRHTSYARAALIAAEEFYGFEDINEHNYADLSAAVAAAGTPGLYERVLCERCGIRRSLLQRPDPKVEGKIFAPVVDQPFFNNFFMGNISWNTFSQPAFCAGRVVQTLDEYLGEAESFMHRAKVEGAVGFKTIVRESNPPDRAAALTALELLRSGKEPVLPTVNPLTDYIHDRLIAVAGELEVPVAVHTGYWRDFRELNPSHIIPLLQRHPKTRFDIYHLGYPYVRETLLLGKTFPNVWLSLCWTHIISQHFATEAMTEALDLVPQNKISAFGGDYGIAVEKVYGHLFMARENTARALASSVRKGRMTAQEAVDTAKLWFYTNPKELYGLKD